MQAFIDRLFGDGTDLDPLQMTARAVAVFLLVLFMIRGAGRRAFGQSRPFDACTTVLLGAVLSRAVVGASPFWSTVCAGAAIVAMHRLVALGSLRWPRFEQLVSGDKRELLRDGVRDVEEMRKGLITSNDLDQAVRSKTGSEHTPIARAVLERNGEISIQARER